MKRIALVDDHSLLRIGFASLIESFNYKVVLQASNGLEFIANCNKNLPIDLVLMDINMPEMDGYETTRWISENLQQTKVLALSMYNNETHIIKMLKAGAKGYILKDSSPAELKAAIKGILANGFHFNELAHSGLFHLSENEQQHNYIPNEREIEFLKLVTTDLTYKEIADQLNVSHRTIDGYREGLFQKLHVKTRVGLAIYAIKEKLIEV